MSKKAYAEDFLSFVNSSPSPHHVVANLSEKLTKAGFTRLDYKKLSAWHLDNKRKFFVEADNGTGGAIAAFTLPSSIHSYENPEFAIIGTHTDSPCLRVKPISEVPTARSFSNGRYIQLGVETYGGGLWRTWFDRDLSLAGRVLVKKHDVRGSNVVASKLIKIDQPILRIPSLAIHLDRTASTEFKFNKETELIPIAGTLDSYLYSGENLPSKKEETEVKSEKEILDDVLEVNNRHPSEILRRIVKEANINEEEGEELLELDLVLYDTQPAVIGGINSDLLFSPRLDNLNSTYAAFTAFIESANHESSHFSVAVAFNHEEVGSETKNGARSNFLSSILRIISDKCKDHLRSQTSTESSLYDALNNSFMLSADMSHAVHPNYASKHEAQHRPRINAGPVIKVNANQRYATDTDGIALLRELAKPYDNHELNLEFKERIPLQIVVVRNDSPCGSTIGPALSTLTGIRTLDIGSPQLSMHSIRETAGVYDLNHSINLFIRFYTNYSSLKYKFNSREIE